MRAEEPAGSPVSPAAARRETTDSVRVATSKLDALLAGVGELVVSQAGVKQDVSELRTLAEELEAWERQWRRTRSESDEDRGRLRTVRSRVVDLHRRLQAGGRRVAEATAGLDEEVRRSRMLPVATMLDAFPRMVRDIAREQGKEVAFVISGAETEVDRFLLEQLTAPLTHIVRNSVGHGVEDPTSGRSPASRGRRPSRSAPPSTAARSRSTCPTTGRGSTPTGCARAPSRRD